MLEKQCRVCEKVLPINEFPKIGGKKCSACFKKHHAEWQRNRYKKEKVFVPSQTIKLSSRLKLKNSPMEITLKINGITIQGLAEDLRSLLVSQEPVITKKTKKQSSIRGENKGGTSVSPQQIKETNDKLKEMLKTHSFRELAEKIGMSTNGLYARLKRGGSKMGEVLYNKIMSAK